MSAGFLVRLSLAKQRHWPGEGRQSDLLRKTFFPEENVEIHGLESIEAMRWAFLGSDVVGRKLEEEKDEREHGQESSHDCYLVFRMLDS